MGKTRNLALIAAAMISGCVPSMPATMNNAPHSARDIEKLESLLKNRDLNTMWSRTYHAPDTIVGGGVRLLDASTEDYELIFFADNVSLSALYTNDGTNTLYDGRDIDSLDRIIRADERVLGTFQEVMSQEAAIRSGEESPYIPIEPMEMQQAYNTDPKRVIQVWREGTTKMLLLEQEGRIYFSEMPKDGTGRMEYLMMTEEYQDILEDAVSSTGESN